MLRKIAVMFSLTAMIIAIYIPAMASPLSRSSDYVFLGDVNENNDVSVSDLVLVNKYILGLEQLSCMQMLKADVNASRDITISDHLRIQDQVLFDAGFDWFLGRGLGDVNRDGRVSILDIVIINKHIAGQITLSGQKFKNADVDGNGQIDRQDGTLLGGCLLGTLDQLPAFHG